MQLSPRTVPATIAILALAASSVVGLALPAQAADPANALGNVVVNEVSSNGFTYHGKTSTDFIELYNKGTANVDLTGYVLSDSNGFPATDKTVLDGVIPVGGFAVIIPPVFGIGAGDSATLYSPSGDVISTYAFTTHRNPSFARVPDGTGDFVVSDGATGHPVPTPGGPNALTTEQAYVSINEYSSDPTDFIELHNDSDAAVDLTGWKLADGDKGMTVGDEIVLGGASAIIPAGGYLSLATEGTPAAGITFVDKGFGLSKADHVYLVTPGGVVADTTWVGTDSAAVTRHAQPSWARTAAGTGLWNMSSAATPGAANTFGAVVPEEPVEVDPNWADIVVNEVSSDNADKSGTIFGAPLADAIELKNTGTTAVNVAGWKQADSGGVTGAVDFSATLKVNGTLSTTIPAGGYGVFSSTKGLGSGGDAVNIYLPDNTLVDTIVYGAGDGGYDETVNADHTYKSWAACADGSDDFWRVKAKSFGADNTTACVDKSPGGAGASAIVINEVTNVGGHVELLNAGTAAVDISGFKFVNKAAAVIHTVPASTTLAAGDFYYVGGLTGLSSADTLTVTAAAGGAIDSFTWEEDGIASYQRCEAFGVWTLSELPTATFDAANACPTAGGTSWPGSQDITIVDEVTTFGDGDGNGEGDVSGATFDPNDPSILWTVQNKNTLFKLTKNPATGKYDDVAGWNGGKKLHFANGTGQLDSEGVTVGPDGALYITSERDNANKDVSYNKIMRFDVSSDLSKVTDLTATTEWDVNSDITTGSNLGLEGITWVPDSVLTEGGFLKNGGGVYVPAAYPNHGSGLFFVAVEATGELHAFALPQNGAPVLVTTLASGFPFSMDVSWDADRQLLWALCDDSCGGAYNTLELVDGEFTVAGSYARPAGMPNLNNEGLAIAPFSESDGDYQEVVFADDGDTDGHSLRGGLLWRTDDLTQPVPPVTEPPVTETPAPVVTPTPEVTQPPVAAPTEFATAPSVAFSSKKAKVGTRMQLRVTQPTPSADKTTYKWTVDGKTVSTSSRFTPTAKYAGEKVTVKVTFAKAGLTTVSRSVVSATIVPKATVTALKYNTVKAGKKQKVTFSNLVPGKKYAVQYRGKKIDTVKANANGKAAVIFKAGTKKGSVKVSIKVGSKLSGKKFTVR